MSSPKKYFHDHVVLLLLSINAFIAIAGSLYMLVSLSSRHSTTYIVQCRDCSNVGAIDRFTNGSIVSLLSLAAFALMVLAIHTILSLRTYKIHRQLAVVILCLGILLLSLTVIIGNALLSLR